jgi:hypothetical protein
MPHLLQAYGLHWSAMFLLSLMWEVSLTPEALCQSESKGDGMSSEMKQTLMSHNFPDVWHSNECVPWNWR